MSKKFLFFVIAVLVIAIITSALYYFFIWKPVAVQVSNEGEVFVEKWVREICTSWNINDLKKYAQDAMLNDLNNDPHAQEKFSAAQNKVGSIKQLTIKAGDVSFNTDSHGKYVIVNYTVNATFEKGNAIITIRMIKSDNQWQIFYFHYTHE